MEYLGKEVDNTPTGRCQVVEEMYNILDGMTSLWDTLRDLKGEWKAINDVLGSKPAWTTKKTPKKRGPDGAPDTERPRTIRRTEGGQDSASTPELEGYEVVDWTVSKTVR